MTKAINFPLIMWLKFTLSIVVLAGIAGWSSQHTAFAAEPDRWTVSAASGDAQALYNGAGWSRIKAGTKLYPGTLIETGKDCRVVITRPGDQVAVSANSRMEIPVRNGNGSFAHIRQLLGTALFKITTRPENPFNVATPYLTAVIKGTTFTVSVNAGKAALHVASGAVQVTSILSRESVLVRPGQTAAVNSRNGGLLRLIGGRNSRTRSGGKATAKAATKSPVKAQKVAQTRAAPSPRNNGTSQASRVKTVVVAGLIPHTLGFSRINVFKVTKGLVNSASKRANVAGNQGKTSNTTTGNRGRSVIRVVSLNTRTARSVNDRKGRTNSLKASFLGGNSGRISSGRSSSGNRVSVLNNNSGPANSGNNGNKGNYGNKGKGK